MAAYGQQRDATNYDRDSRVDKHELTLADFSYFSWPASSAIDTSTAGPVVDASTSHGPSKSRRWLKCTLEYLEGMQFHASQPRCGLCNTMSAQRPVKGSSPLLLLTLHSSNKALAQTHWGRNSSQDSQSPPHHLETKDSKRH